MDLIYADGNMTDIGVLKNYTFDLAYGEDENNFTISTAISNNVLQTGYYIYIDGTEYGGIVDGIAVDTKERSIVYSGRTWHGILNSKVVVPDAGQAYLTVSGDANSIIEMLISRFGLEEIFSAETRNAGVDLQNYQFDRYSKGYDAIAKMLKSAGAKLRIKFNSDTVSLSAEKISDYSDNEEFSNGKIDFEIEKQSNRVNHLICLGKGELEERQVIDLYVQHDGTISETPAHTGISDYTDIYDYPSVESIDELRASGIEKLQELNSEGKLNVSVDNTKNYDIGDIVGGYEENTGTQIIARIAKKIIKIEQDKILTEYKVGN